MKREPVESSSIAAVGYLPARRLMEIEFRNGGVYEYQGVPDTLYREFLRADSHGRFFTQHIRPGGFPYRKVA
jgi:hypothetical protein